MLKKNETLDSIPTCRFTIYMALRVLLADESLNIKKNMQISLQDYGIEIKSLLTGEEIAHTTKIFKPDIIFMDILLPKINGYDACSQLKNHPDFRHLPVILTWSNFMEIDETKFRQSRADGRLEKPFDKQNLRKMIQHFVPKTKSQGLSEFLTLPELRPLDGSAELEKHYSKTLPHFTPKGMLGDFKMEDEEEEEFHQQPLSFHSTVPEISPLTTQNDEEPEDWVPRSIHAASSPPMEENYEVEIAKVHLPPEPPFPPPSPDIDTLALMGRPRKSSPPTPPKYSGPPPKIEWNNQQLQEMIRAELRPILEEILAKALPEIAERVIREEIQNLMKDTENEL